MNILFELLQRKIYLRLALTFHTLTYSFVYFQLWSRGMMTYEHMVMKMVKIAGTTQYFMKYSTVIIRKENINLI